MGCLGQGWRHRGGAPGTKVHTWAHLHASRASGGAGTSLPPGHQLPRAPIWTASLQHRGAVTTPILCLDP